MRVMLVSMAIVLAACGLGNSGAGGSVVDGEWELIHGVPLAEGSPITMTIHGSSLTGRAACNSYAADLSVEDGNVSIGDITQTEMACDPAVMQSERLFLAALDGVTSMVVVDGTLLLSGPDVSLGFDPAG